MLFIMLVLTSCLRSTDDDTPPADNPEINDTMNPAVGQGDADNDPSVDFAGENDEENKTDDKPLPPTVGEEDESGVVPVSAILLDRNEITLHIGQIDMPWETIYPFNASDKSTRWKSSDPSVASVDGYGRITARAEGTCTVTTTSVSNPDAISVVNVTVTPSAYPNEPTYIDGILIANKTYPLPENYNPGIDPTASAALDEMIAAAKDDGISLFIISGFRSFERQQELYSNYLLREGRDAADRYSARPGYSEHQSGLAFDLNSLEFSFGETPEGKWLASHCHEYGFIIRYPYDKEDVTGYMYEPWHVRYLGTETAAKVYESGLCLEEYLDITSEYK